jgi:hypothetical protein
MKAASNELISLGSHMGAAVDGLYYPLMTVIDYKGYRYQRKHTSCHVLKFSCLFLEDWLLRWCSPLTKHLVNMVLMIAVCNNRTSIHVGHSNAW